MTTKTQWVRNVADFAPEQIYTPEAVLHVANEGQPGWTTGVVSRPIVAARIPSNNVFVDWDVESQGNLLSDSRTAPGGIALLHLDDASMSSLLGPFGPGLLCAWRRRAGDIFDSS